MKQINYRKLAFEHYRDRLFCAHCGFGISEVLEVAHLDGQRYNNDISNLVLLCHGDLRAPVFGDVPADRLARFGARLRA